MVQADPDGVERGVADETHLQSGLSTIRPCDSGNRQDHSVHAHRAWRDEEGNRLGEPLRLYSVAQLHAVDAQIWAERRDRFSAIRA